MSGARCKTKPRYPLQSHVKPLWKRQMMVSPGYPIDRSHIHSEHKDGVHLPNISKSTAHHLRLAAIYVDALSTS